MSNTTIRKIRNYYDYYLSKGAESDFWDWMDSRSDGYTAEERETLQWELKRSILLDIEEYHNSK